MLPYSFLCDERGATALVFAAAIGGLVCIAGLTVTVSHAFLVRAEAQGSIDAAVLAGASAPSTTTDDERILIAETIYRGNQHQGETIRSDIDVRRLPPAQFRVSNTVVYGTVELRLDSGFLGVFGKDYLTLNVTGAARIARAAPICVLGLDPSEEETVDINGNARVELQNCALQANSADNAGIRQRGTSSISALDIGVTGNYEGENYEPMPVPGTAPVTDPLAALPLPAVEACAPLSGQRLQQAVVTLEPGTYCGGIDIQAQSQVTLLPGIYVMKDGPFSIDADSHVTGDEVMIAFLGPTSTLYIYSGSSLTVTSPTSGPYANIQFFGDRTVYPAANGSDEHLWFTVIGDSRLTYDGVLYMPQHHVWWAGGSIITGSSPNYLAIAKKLWFQDNTDVTLTLSNERGIEAGEAVALGSGAVLFH